MTNEIKLGIKEYAILGSVAIIMACGGLWFVHLDVKQHEAKGYTLVEVTNVQEAERSFGYEIGGIRGKCEDLSKREAQDLRPGWYICESPEKVCNTRSLRKSK